MTAILAECSSGMGPQPNRKRVTTMADGHLQAIVEAFGSILT
jgi:hypothetical protein